MDFVEFQSNSFIPATEPGEREAVRGDNASFDASVLMPPPDIQLSLHLIRGVIG
jgi:hypothetical protein